MNTTKCVFGRIVYRVFDLTGWYVAQAGFVGLGTDTIDEFEATLAVECPEGSPSIGTVPACARYW